MKLIIQRVKSASVKVAKTSKTVSIEKGIFVLVGVKKGDTVKKAEELASKLIKLRIMADKENKMNLSIKDTKDEILVVSQFTLYANTKDGNRPSFLDAESPEKAEKIYKSFVNFLSKGNIKTKTGFFGRYMLINCELDGPVTIILEN
jgi:D-tyrosyl-tRNA(Tyr) deacylase